MYGFSFTGNTPLSVTFQERNTYYVVQVEIFLSKVFSSDAVEDDEDVLYVPLCNTLAMFAY